MYQETRTKETRWDHIDSVRFSLAGLDTTQKRKQSPMENNTVFTDGLQIKDYKLNMGEQSFIQRRLPSLAVVLPEAPGPGLSADDSSFSPGMTCPYFHVDSACKSCFSKEEAARASQRIVDIELVKQVQRQILTTDFVLPQVKKTVDAAFCNESVYGKMNFLMVTGLVRLG